MSERHVLIDLSDIGCGAVLVAFFAMLAVSSVAWAIASIFTKACP